MNAGRGLPPSLPQEGRGAWAVVSVFFKIERAGGEHLKNRPSVRERPRGCPAYRLGFTSRQTARESVSHESLNRDPARNGFPLDLLDEISRQASGERDQFHRGRSGRERSQQFDQRSLRHLLRTACDGGRDFLDQAQQFRARGVSAQPFSQIGTRLAQRREGGRERSVFLFGSHVCNHSKHYNVMQA